MLDENIQNPIKPVVKHIQICTQIYLYTFKQIKTKDNITRLIHTYTMKLINILRYDMRLFILNYISLILNLKDKFKLCEI